MLVDCEEGLLGAGEAGFQMCDVALREAPIAGLVICCRGDVKGVQG